MAKRIAPELSALSFENSRLGEQFQDAVRGRPVAAEMHAIVGLNDSLVDLHSQIYSLTAQLAQTRAEERRLRDALKEISASDDGFAFARRTDNPAKLIARRALEGK